MSSYSMPDLARVIESHWGFQALRPLQEQAMRAVIENRDSLVVLPTGGGKSLCYQAPAVLRGGTTVVVSPLISLMKDQVDSLQACGVPAIQIDSSLSPGERSTYERDIAQGAVRLLFVSPERLVLTDFCTLLRRIDVRTFAIDEAHCISHWGHDFRPEYRQLRKLKEWFPGASIHGYTATATEQVRKDIVDQLGLSNPEVLVGNFDRPNLNYRVLARLDLERQVREVLERHKNEAGIIYCIRRKDVDELNALLQSQGYKSLAYHAGLPPEERRRVQEAFAAEECDLIVATVAFGMGIDRSNIRFVLHSGMPKSVEHYQQETGRAGRDGLEAECVLLHAGSDTATWKWILEKSAEDNAVDSSFLPNALRHLRDMERYCRGAVCRHRALVQYFGQTYHASTCRACDLCLGDTEPVPDAQLVAQKILSCVARVQERFGIGHVTAVLRGENTVRVRQLQHDRLSTFGLLKEYDRSLVRDWIHQLISQGVLLQEGDEYPILRLNDNSWEVMKKQGSVRLLQPVRRQEPVERSLAESASWSGVDRELFEELKQLRRDVAQERQVQPYMVFSDATLRELARRRPSTDARMRGVIGIGDVQLSEFGDRFLHVIRGYCEVKRLPMDVRVALGDPGRQSHAPTPAKLRAFAMFREGTGIDEVARQVGRSRKTVAAYLEDFIQREQPADISPWVSANTYARVSAVIRHIGAELLRPLYEALNESVSYEEIRAVRAHVTAVARQSAQA